jgi:hypothetical protein
MQIREFINKLGGLQSEHQSLRTRILILLYKYAEKNIYIYLKQLYSRYWHS